MITMEKTRVLVCGDNTEEMLSMRGLFPWHNRPMNHALPKGLTFQTAGLQKESLNAGKRQPLGDHFWCQFSCFSTTLIVKLKLLPYSG